jgi:hypothetical protein
MVQARHYFVRARRARGVAKIFLRGRILSRARGAAQVFLKSDS